MRTISPKSQPSVNIESKSILARLLATENLIVEHQNVPTATFNTEDRILTLPMWESMSSTVYDMLVQHEVAHALFTPVVDYRSILETIDPVNPMSCFSYLNIVEDARIEKKMQRKFPGGKRDFYRGYQEMWQSGIFEIDPANIMELGIADKVNLHFKCGHIIDIPFTDEQQRLVDMIAGVETWSETIEATKALVEFAKEEAETKTEKVDEAEFSDENSDGQSGQDQGGFDSDSDDEAEDQGQNGGGSDTEGEDTEDAECGPSQGEGDMESDEEAEDDGSCAESTEGQPTKSQGGCGSDDAPIEEPTTVGSLEEYKASMVDRDRPEIRRHATVATADLSDCVLDAKQVLEVFKNDVRHHDHHLDMPYKEFVKNTKKIVNTMVQQFNMKKAAAEFERTEESKTGVIDPCQLVNYKFSEDLFLRNEVSPQGKNHGMIMLMDWSSSMNDQMIVPNMIHQIMIMVEFCRKVGIPFKVFIWDDYNRRGDGVFGGPQDYSNPGFLQLIELTSSDLSSKDINQSLKHMILLAMHKTASHRKAGCSPFVGNHRAYQRISCPFLAMGGTPLEPAMFTLRTVANAFRAKHNIEILNTIIATDGSGDRECFTTESQVRVRHSDGSLAKDMTGHAGCMRWFAKETGSRMIGIHICSTYGKGVGYNIGNMPYRLTQDLDTHREIKWEMTEGCKSQGWWKSPEEMTLGFDEWFAIAPSHTKIKGVSDLKDGSNRAVIKNAFVRENNRRKSMSQLGRIIAEATAANLF